MNKDNIDAAPAPSFGQQLNAKLDTFVETKRRYEDAVRQRTELASAENRAQCAKDNEEEAVWKMVAGRLGIDMNRRDPYDVLELREFIMAAIVLAVAE